MFVSLELTSADANYHEKLQSNDKDAKSLFSLGWRVEELNQLVKCSQTYIATVSHLIDVVADMTVDLIRSNVARQLSNIRDSLSSFIQDLSRHQRVMATHIFVLMISSELRNTKPYAVPVQCLPYRSMKHHQLRNIVCTLIKEMKQRGMRVAGEKLYGTIHLCIHILD